MVSYNCFWSVHHHPPCRPHTTYAQSLAGSWAPLRLAFTFHSVLKGYSIQYSLPTFIQLANFFYLSELGSSHPFSEPLPTSLSVWTEWPSAVPPKLPKLLSAKALSQHHCHHLFAFWSTHKMLCSQQREIVPCYQQPVNSTQHMIV